MALLLLLMLAINKVVKPALQVVRDAVPPAPPMLASVGPDESEIQALPRPNDNAAKLGQVRALAQQDPRAVAEVVKQWVGKNE